MSLSRANVRLGLDESVQVFMRILVGDDTPAGDYTITITGTAGLITYSIQLHVTVVRGDEQNDGGLHQRVGIR
ncbi:MAG TPA: hypothetical protein VFE98_09505 [Candidatus Bathyarchaeia archaeon]|nr:hypothetical protein [Candidatus Bathyarchaeia archaeon]